MISADFPKIRADKWYGSSGMMDPHAYPHHMKECKHLIYVWHACHALQMVCMQTATQEEEALEAWVQWCHIIEFLSMMLHTQVQGLWPHTFNVMWQKSGNTLITFFQSFLLLAAQSHNNNRNGLLLSQSSLWSMTPNHLIVCQVAPRSSASSKSLPCYGGWRACWEGSWEGDGCPW
jgi:hypothetical protein